MKKTVFRLNFLTACISLGIVSQAWAGHTYFGIDYQYYRDFAENKGKFTVGAKNIEVYNKNGNLVGTSMTKAPMIDFSVVSRNGVAALVGDQYIVSVAHNVGYTNVDFGAEGNNPDQHRFTYKIVKRNNYKHDAKHRYLDDYHNPRLHKFVTDAAPIDMTSHMDGNKYANKEKYPERVRVGSGDQYWDDDQNNRTYLSDGYNYLTGGNTYNQSGRGDGYSYVRGDIRKVGDYGPLPIASSFGDSGSPMFIYDAETQKWLINGVLREGQPYTGEFDGFQLARKSFLDEIIRKDQPNGFLTPKGNGVYTISKSDDGIGVVTSKIGKPREIPLANNKLKIEDKDTVYNNRYNGPNIYSPQLNNGKNIYFGDEELGSITLTTDIDQGAGGLYFEGDFIVSPTKNETWKGAGIHVSEISTVTWKVNGVENDRLSKIGKGTLHVKAKGENKGSISVGDGKVILEQQTDDQGKKTSL